MKEQREKVILTNKLDRNASAGIPSKGVDHSEPVRINTISERTDRLVSCGKGWEWNIFTKEYSNREGIHDEGDQEPEIRAQLQGGEALAVKIG